MAQSPHTQQAAPLTDCNFVQQQPPNNDEIFTDPEFGLVAAELSHSIHLCLLSIDLWQITMIGIGWRVIVKLREGSGKDRQGMALKAKGLKA